MKGEEAIAYTLKDIGIKEVFLTYDTPSLLLDQLIKYEIKPNLCNSTREAVILADSYSRENNTVGTVIQIPGVKLLEATDIISQAYVDSQPLLIISSLRSYRDTGKSRVGELRTPDDLMEIFKPITKMAERVLNIEELIFTIEKGYKEALSNRNRPAYVEVPEDLFKLKAYPLTPAEQKPEKKAPDKNTVAKVAELLNNSKNPVILAGYGVLASGAHKELLELAELLDIPVILTFRAKGSIPSSHPLFAGEGLGLFATEEGRHIIEESDLIIALGTKFNQLSTAGWSMKIKGYLVNVNVDGEDISKVYMPHVPVVADVGLFLRELLNTIKTKIKEPIKRGTAEKIKKFKKAISLPTHSEIWPYDVVMALENYNFSKIFVDISSTTLDLVRIPVEKPNTWFTSESLINRSIGVGGISRSNDENVIAVTDIKGVLDNASILVARMNKAKGKLLVLNDGKSSILDVVTSDIPSIVKTGQIERFDEVLTRMFNAVNVSNIEELKKAINENTGNLKVINVKIDPNFESVLFK